MSSFDFSIHCSGNEQVVDLIPKLIRRNKNYSMQARSPTLLELKHKKPETSPQEKEADRAGMETSLLELGFTKSTHPGDGPQDFILPVGKANRESTKERPMGEDTLIDEEDQINRDAVFGEKESSQEGRTSHKCRIAEDSRIDQQRLDYIDEWVSRGFESFGNGLRRELRR
ncbi:hypothetical protein TgHK011_000064 [Trichoderma gracile]|nr:hypothetical protein TgHK011_000064 [Trichoderma gracile]